MAETTVSTIERTRQDIAELRRGLNDLSFWFGTHLAEIPRANEIQTRVSRLGEFLERLNAGLEDQARERAQLVGLAQISRAVNSTLDLNQVLDRAMDIIIQVTHAERGFLMLADHQGELTFRAARNLEHSTIASPAFQVSRSILAQVAASGAPVLTTNAAHDPRFADSDSVVMMGLRSILCTPLKSHDHVIGVVYVDNRLREGMFQPADLDALRAFADQAAIAIENAQLFENVAQKVDEISALKTFQDNIFASIASGVVATDLQDRITACNRAAEAIFDITAAQAIGQSYRDVLAPLWALRFPGLVDDIKNARRARGSTEIKATLPKRGSVNLNVNIASLKDASGNSQGLAIVVDDVTEKRKLEATSEMFRRYVAPAVVDRLTSHPELVKLGGQRQQITILFADIRGFTHFSEPLPPEELIDVLNEYFSVAADAILAQEGTLDKFIGDALMAIFNAPLTQDDHALRAARAALHLRDAVKQLHERMPKKLRLSFGIGIHTGEAVVGNVGTEQQMNFTAIGDAVNLAKRLQENASRGQILLSRQTHALIRRHSVAKRLLPLKVKGRAALADVWELTGVKSV